jgi:hypothetical protein
MTNIRSNTPATLLYSSIWSIGGELPTLPPNIKGRIYFMFLADNGDGKKIPPSAMADVQIFTVEQWISARGPD